MDLQRTVTLNMDELSAVDDVDQKQDEENLEQDEERPKKNFDFHALETLLTKTIVQRSPVSPQYLKQHKKLILNFLVIISLGIYCIFAIMVSGLKKCIELFVFVMIVTVIVVYITIRDHFGKQINVLLIKPIKWKINQHWRILRWVIYGTLLLLILLWILLDTIKDIKRLRSAAGMLVFILLAYLMSMHRTKVSWRPVLWGIALQFVFGILILRTKKGFDVMKYLGDKISEFLEFTVYGVEFVFGESYYLHFIAFKVLMVVIFFSSVASVLYYVGIMEVIILKLAWLMQITLQVSGIEALCAASNVFVGLVILRGFAIHLVRQKFHLGGFISRQSHRDDIEAPLLVGHFVESATISELHSILTSGLATISGGMLAAYVSLGVDPHHVLTASVMSAPAALAISKLVYPETEKPETSEVSGIRFKKRNEKNVIEAAAQGASVAIGLVANIGANLIAFFAYLAFINSMLSYLGSLVSYPELSFELICSYLFAPFAYLMGVDWDDCTKVGRLVGVKTFLNEFIAFGQLSKFINNRKSMLPGPVLSLRSETIAVYVLTGFTNFLSLGIFLGGYGQLAPRRKSDMAKIAIRGLISGTWACMMTACVAGILYQEDWDKTVTVTEYGT